MTREKLIALLKNEGQFAQIELCNENLEGMKSNLKHFAKNEIIFNDGDSTNSIFLIVSGEVMTSNHKEVKSYSEKEYFGIEDLVKETNRKRKAIAIKPSVVLEFIVYDKQRIEPQVTISNISADFSINTKTNQSPDIIKLGITRNFDQPFFNVKYKDVLIIFINLKKATLVSSKAFIKHIENSIREGQNKIILDLRTCTLIDSTFLGAIVKSLRTTIKNAGEMVLVYTKEDQSTLFMITYMDKVFSTFNDLEEAINSFY